MSTPTSPKAGMVRKAEEERPVLTDEAVLEYLKNKGLGSAALELTNHLKEEKQQGKQHPKSLREQLEEEDAMFRTQRSLLTKVRFVRARLRV